MLIDAHVHIWLGYDADKIVNHMDGLQISKAWLLTWEEMEGGLQRHYQHLSIHDVYEAWQKHPDRFVPFYAPDPRRDDCGKLLKSWVAKGIKGYGEHKVKLGFDDARSVAMYQLCGELGLPVLFHLEVPLYPGDDYWYNRDMDAVERVLRICPETVFVGHGPGWWREISGDADKSPDTYPKGAVVPDGKLPRMLEEYQNLYADLSANSGLNALQRDPEFGNDFLNKFHSSILYGSDNFASEHIEYLRSLGLAEEVFEAIVCRNAERLIG